MDRESLLKAAKARHSVRAYDGRALEEEDAAWLRGRIAEVNAESGLNIQVVIGDGRAFDTLLAHYGKFTGVQNYLVFVGPDTALLDEACGYWGELLALEAQARGMRTCWVGGTFSRRKTRFAAASGERMSLVMSIGYGTTDGRQHPARKTAADVSSVPEGVEAPAWFAAGVEAALLAPTAIHQQKFHFAYVPVIGKTAGQGDDSLEGKVRATPGSGPFTQVDLGIAKLHFELGSAKGREVWQ